MSRYGVNLFIAILNVNYSYMPPSAPCWACTGREQEASGGLLWGGWVCLDAGSPPAAGQDCSWLLCVLNKLKSTAIVIMTNRVYLLCYMYMFKHSQVALIVKNPPANPGDISDSASIPGSGRSPGEGNSNPLQYACLGNPTDRGAWWVTVHGVTESDTTEHSTTIHLHHLFQYSLQPRSLPSCCSFFRNR